MTDPTSNGWNVTPLPCTPRPIPDALPASVNVARRWRDAHMGRDVTAAEIAALIPNPLKEK